MRKIISRISNHRICNSDPLRTADFLIKVKQGKLDYLSEVGPVLETLMEEVESLALTSKLPQTVDRIFWDQFICETLERELF